MAKTIELIGLVYKSVDYTRLLDTQLRTTTVPGWDVRYRIVANDPTSEVCDALYDLDTDSEIYNDKKPDDYYLNRVYRCWNYAGKSSKASNICFVNSDMVFSAGWLERLLAHHDGNNIPCSRLVESGKKPSGPHGISEDCGRSPKDINYKKWWAFVLANSVNTIQPGGLYMPCVFSTDLFKATGGYPEGNIYYDGAGTLHGHVVQSGDAFYFQRLEKEYGMKHITVFDSLVYHIQEGEMDS